MSLKEYKSLNDYKVNTRKEVLKTQKIYLKQQLRFNSIN